MRKTYIYVLMVTLLVTVAAYNACDNMGNLENGKTSSSQIPPLNFSKNNLSYVFMSNKVDVSTLVSNGTPPFSISVTQGSSLVLSGSAFNPNIIGKYVLNFMDASGAQGALALQVVDSAVAFDFSKSSLNVTVNGVSNSQLLQVSRSDQNMNVGSSFNAAGLLTFVNAGLPRFGASGQGLFIEQGSQNLILTSEDFGTNWTAGSVDPTIMTITPNVATAPDGSMTADNVDFQAVMGTYLVSNAVVAPVVAIYTGSVWAMGRVAGQMLTLHLNGTNAANLGFPLTNTWTRYSITGLAAAGASVSLQLDNDINGQQLENATFWGTQLEIGSVPSSFIPSNGAVLSRGNDVAQITDLSQFLGYGTIVLEFEVNRLPSPTNSYVFGMSNGVVGANPADGIYIAGMNQGGSTAVQVISGGVSQQTTGGSNPVWALGKTYKIAFTYGRDGIVAYENGIFAGSISGVTIPTSTLITFGYSGGHGATSYANNYIRSFKYYPAEGTQNDLIRLSQ